MQSRVNRFLLGYAALLSTALAGYFIDENMKVVRTVDPTGETQKK